jgi:hypothetical protein
MSVSATAAVEASRMATTIETATVAVPSSRCPSAIMMMPMVALTPILIMVVMVMMAFR